MSLGLDDIPTTFPREPEHGKFTGVVLKYFV